jgi:transcriptional regulator with XRE-family HTH domain
MDAINISAAQCRAARAMLGIGIRELAAKADVSTNTLSRLESGAELGRRTLGYIRAALEGMGVVFINGDEPGVKLRKLS